MPFSEKDIMPLAVGLLTARTTRMKKIILFMCVCFVVSIVGHLGALWVFSGQYYNCHTKDNGGIPSLKIASTTRCNRVVIALPALPHTGTVT